MVALAFGSASLIIILSVFNGLEGLIRSLHNYFDPQLKIEAVEGKSFEITPGLLDSVKNVEGVAVVTEVIEDNVYIAYRNSTMVVKLKGVSDNFIEQHRLDERIVQGELKLKDQGNNFAVIGVGVQYRLGVVNLKELFALRITYPNRKATSTYNTQRLINTKNLLTAGVFAIEKQYDDNYIFVPIDFARDLMDYDKRISYLEIKTHDKYEIADVQAKIKATLGENFRVLNSDQQHQSLIRAVKMEKLIVFLIITLIVGILSFNSFFSLTMLAIDKTKDISVLFSLGADKGLIRKIFLWESVLISLIGTLIGLFIGTIFCIIQQQFGLLKLGMSTSVMENYPVQIQAVDYGYILIVITAITFLTAIKPSSMAGNLKSLRFN